ncbi:MAG: uncharacterized protein A8A55_3316, partial [Amphiamblys sp. WSBS2006]
MWHYKRCFIKKRMFDLARKSFAKHGDSFFLEEGEGVLIVSEAVLEKIHEDIQKEREFLYEKRLEVVKQRVMNKLRQKEQKRHKELEEKDILGTEKRDLSGVMC